MGKKKEQAPEPEEAIKIFRKLGENLSIEVSEAEKKYRNKNSPDSLDEIGSHKLKCTVCLKSVVGMLKKGREPYVHMLLDVLICKDCVSFYGDGCFSADEDGDDKYCRWCGQGGTLYLCSACTCAFCKKCIRQNLDRSVLKDMESDSWKCLICDPEPLYDCRTVCWAVQEFARKTKEDSDESPAKSSKKDREKKNDESSGSRKRKASEIDDDSDIEVITKKVKESNSSSSRKPQDNKKKRKSKIDTSDDEKDENKSPSRRSKRSTGDSLLKDGKKKELDEEIDLAGDHSDDGKRQKENSKKSTKRGSLNDSPKALSSLRNTSVKEKNPRRSSSIKQSEAQKKTEKTPASTSGKNKKENAKSKSEPLDTPIVKRSQRTSVIKTQCRDNSDKERDGKDPIEKSSKTIPETKKNKDEKAVSIISPGKNADRKVVEASRYINSALKDVMELTTLISVRCNKLCSKSLQSHADVVVVFNKMKKLIDGVHTNLNLIEKGLDSKVLLWKGENEEKNSKEDEHSSNKANNNGEGNEDPKVEPQLDKKVEDFRTKGAKKEIVGLDLEENDPNNSKSENETSKSIGERIMASTKENEADAVTSSDGVADTHVIVSNCKLLNAKSEDMDVQSKSTEIDNENTIDSTRPETENMDVDADISGIEKCNTSFESNSDSTKNEQDGMNMINEKDNDISFDSSSSDKNKMDVESDSMKTEEHSMDIRSVFSKNENANDDGALDSTVTENLSVDGDSKSTQENNINLDDSTKASKGSSFCDNTEPSNGDQDEFDVVESIGKVTETNDADAIESEEVTEENNDADAVQSEEVTEENNDADAVQSEEVTEENNDADAVQSEEVTEENNDADAVQSEEVTEENNDADAIQSEKMTDEQNEVTQSETVTDNTYDAEVTQSEIDAGLGFNGFEDIWEDSSINDGVQEELDKDNEKSREVSSIRLEEKNVEATLNSKNENHSADEVNVGVDTNNEVEEKEGSNPSEQVQEDLLESPKENFKSVIVNAETGPVESNVETKSLSEPNVDAKSLLESNVENKGSVELSKEESTVSENKDSVSSSNEDLLKNGVDAQDKSQNSKERDDLNKSIDSTSSVNSKEEEKTPVKTPRPDERRSSERGQGHYSGDRHHPHSGDRGRYSHGGGRDRDRWSGDRRDWYGDQRHGGQYGHYNKYDRHYGWGRPR